MAGFREIDKNDQITEIFPRKSTQEEKKKGTNEFKRFTDGKPKNQAATQYLLVIKSNLH